MPIRHFLIIYFPLTLIKEQKANSSIPTPRTKYPKTPEMSKLDTQGSLPTPGDLPYPGISEAIAAAIANLSREMQEGFKQVNDRFEEIERTMNISYVFPVVCPKEALLTAFCTAKPIQSLVSSILLLYVPTASSNLSLQ